MEQQESKVLFRSRSMETEANLFSVCSTNGEHFIRKSEILNNDEENIRDDDRIIALNDQSVSHFDHVTIVEMLKELLDFSQEGRCITLVIDRKEQDGDLRMIEIKLSIYQPTDIDIDAGFNFSYVIKKIFQRDQPYVYNVKYIFSYDCYISECNDTKYVKCTAENKLDMESLPRDVTERGGFTFKCCNYLVLSGTKKHPNNTYVCILRVEKGTAEKGLYITVKNEEDVYAEEFPHPDRDVDLEKADSRFFILKKTPNGKDMFESLAYEGRYLSWTRTRVSLRQLPSEKPQQYSGDLNNDCKFEITSHSFIGN
ncbi:uncharacterized protein LOC127738235 [Mytilus californianus]|uniref:uncharacterized protein LOC127738235 n=1 Tax=Mytilus californianus TaxID=6549 RepID=UPI0022453882|nr:uncharacterized protein LOC127738235 [Mytilus californianus]